MVRARWGSGRKALATLGPAARDDAGSTHCRHPLAKPMATLAHEPARLISPLHVSLSVAIWRMAPLGLCGPACISLRGAEIAPRDVLRGYTTKTHHGGSGQRCHARGLPKTTFHRIERLYGARPAPSTIVTSTLAPVRRLFSLRGRAAVYPAPITSLSVSSSVVDGPSSKPRLVLNDTVLPHSCCPSASPLAHPVGLRPASAASMILTTDSLGGAPFAS